ncbi:MAG: NAD(P)-dependent oxidoreductase [Caldimonas sp.]
MDLLVVDSLEADVMEWLGERYSVRVAPHLALEPREFRRSLYNVRAAIVPASVTIDTETLDFAPVLKAIGRVSAGLDNIDLAACERRRIEVVRSLTAGARAEAEFLIGAMLSLLRRVPVRSPDGSVAGRELGGATIGLVGMAPTARSVAKLLSGFDAHIIGYDPALHASDSVWELWKVAPAGLRELVERSDVMCVQLAHFTRYQGLLGDRFLPHCKPNQVVVSTAHSALFDETALAAALRSGRIAAAWLDSVEPGVLDPTRPLHGIETLHVSPRIAATTREARQRSAWAVVRRIDELLDFVPRSASDFSETIPSEFAGLEAASWSP